MANYLNTDAQIGKKFGKLTVVEYVGKRAGYHMYKARCDCGCVRLVRWDRLRYGIVRSCGRGYKDGAKQRARDCREALDGVASPTASLTAEDVRYIRRHYGPHGRNGCSGVQLADEFGVSRQVIYDVVRRVSYKSVK